MGRFAGTPVCRRAEDRLSGDSTSSRRPAHLLVSLLAAWIRRYSIFSAVKLPTVHEPIAADMSSSAKDKSNGLKGTRAHCTSLNILAACCRCSVEMSSSIRMYSPFRPLSSRGKDFSVAISSDGWSPSRTPAKTLLTTNRTHRKTPAAIPTISFTRIEWRFEPSYCICRIPSSTPSTFSTNKAMSLAVTLSNWMVGKSRKASLNIGSGLLERHILTLGCLAASENNSAIFWWSSPLRWAMVYSSSSKMA